MSDDSKFYLKLAALVTGIILVMVVFLIWVHERKRESIEACERRGGATVIGDRGSVVACVDPKVLR